MASTLPALGPATGPTKLFPAPTRRRFLASAAAMGSGILLARPAFAIPGLEERLTGLCGRLWQDHLRRFPEQATAIGADSRANLALRGKLNDYSRAGREDWFKAAADAGKRLALIESEILDDAPRTDHAVLTRFHAEIATLGRRWQFGDAASPAAPYALSPLNGPHTSVPGLLATRHQIVGPADAEAWLARLGAFAGALDGATEAFRADAAAGITAPTSAITTTLAQLAELSPPDPARHPLALAFARQTAAAGLAGDWQSRAAAVLAKAVYPALARQNAALAATRQRDGHDGGVASLPEGRAFYADALAYHTGKSFTPGEVHRIGLAEVAEVGAELDVMLARMALPGGALGARLAGLDCAPGQVFTDCAEGRTAVLQAFDKAIGRASSHLADQFDMLPPRARAVLGSPGSSDAAADASPASTITIDPARLDQLRRFMIPTTAFHEGLPGPSWESAGARTNPQLPAIRRHAVRYQAYTDGWALYAEHVADESGLYADDPASRVGYLRSRLLRAALLVVDTGLHDKGWSRRQAIAYLSGVTGRTAASVAPVVERAILLPGEACAAAIGRQEWLRLRALAERLAGDRFDPRRFHDVIAEGRAPFDVLDERITARFNPRLSVLEARTV